MLIENRTSAPVEQDDSVNFRGVLRHLVVHPWWTIVCVILSTAAFSTVAFTTRPVYRATAVLTTAATDRGDGVLNLASSTLGGLASGLGIGGPRDADTQEALAVLHSRELTEAFITDKKLMPRLFPTRWDSAAGRWNTDEQHQPTLAQAYKYFDQKVRSITEDRKTGLITLQIDWTDRAEAADWAIELVHRVNEEMRSREITKADASLHFLQEELQTTSEIEIRNALAHLMEAQVKKRMIAHVTQDYSLRFVDRPVATDGEKPIRPQKMLLLALGPMAGLALGIMLTLLFRPLSRRER